MIEIKRLPLPDPFPHDLPLRSRRLAPGHLYFDPAQPLVQCPMTAALLDREIRVLGRRGAERYWAQVRQATLEN